MRVIQQKTDAKKHKFDNGRTFIKCNSIYQFKVYGKFLKVSIANNWHFKNPKVFQIPKKVSNPFPKFLRFEVLLSL